MLGIFREDSKNSSDAFSAATLFYARLRRVTGRVVDVLYIVDNKEYARYVIEIAYKAGDTELDRLIRRLHDALDLTAYEEPAAPVLLTDEIKTLEPAYQDEAVTEEEIYKAQVSHHYIGALR